MACSPPSTTAPGPAVPQPPSARPTYVAHLTADTTAPGPAVPQPPSADRRTWLTHRRCDRPGTGGASATVCRPTYVAHPPPVRPPRDRRCLSHRLQTDVRGSLTADTTTPGPAVPQPPSADRRTWLTHRRHATPGPAVPQPPSADRRTWLTHHRHDHPGAGGASATVCRPTYVASSPPTRPPRGRRCLSHRIETDVRGYLTAAESATAQPAEATTARRSDHRRAAASFPLSSGLAAWWRVPRVSRQCSTTAVS